MTTATDFASSPNALNIRGLQKEYVPGKPILKGIDIEINSPGIIAIIGPSGTGKSTLLRCINRLIEPTAGEIIFHQSNLCLAKGRQLRQLRRHVGMVFQEYNLVERLSVIENVLTGRLGYMSAWNAWRRKFSQTDIDMAFQLLESVGLTEHANKRADSLSGGQRQRVGIARAVMQDPHILLADEPTSSLDPKTAVEIMELLEKFAEEKNIPTLVNIHDVNLARRFAKRMIGMSDGVVVYDGAPEGITDAHLKQIYGGESWLV
ncbi:phosphonate ABC transporter ATP-binding protein [Maribrevibacterium harenarium]|uniref:Phosphonate ABC transporter ATP-binding protein n=1 Tax=Maribrevibacterium harenarium TaxID=2589817 RepID=A0A501W6Y2_9GAMM|nr:phosphonate ABC transporter ATP-binding protein [Maribrevibacterium harenarium]TPE45663.1 phosphonate ABC transporter ATP-binding protein [Maribrevibacterium harenarium]